MVSDLNLPYVARANDASSLIHSTGATEVAEALPEFPEYLWKASEDIPNAHQTVTPSPAARVTNRVNPETPPFGSSDVRQTRSQSGATKRSKDRKDTTSDKGSK